MNYISNLYAVLYAFVSYSFYEVGVVLLCPLLMLKFVNRSDERLRDFSFRLIDKRSEIMLVLR